MTMKKYRILPFIMPILLIPEIYGQQPGRETLAPSYPDSVIIFKFDAQGDSSLNAKMTYRYDNHFHVTESEKFVREQSLNLWTPNRKEVREYDNHDRRTLWAIYEWDNNEMAYKGWMKETTLFDNHGNKAEYHYYTWDYTTYYWGNRFWDLFEYDNENKLMRRDHLEWNTASEQWDTASYDVYEYGDDDLLQRMTTWEPEEGSGIIYPNKRVDYEYDGFGNVDTITYQIYNPYTELWYWTSRFQYEYDAQNRKTQWMYSEYDEQGEKWIDKEKDEWEWDDNDSLTVYSYYRIGEDLVTWYPDHRLELTYNSHGKLIHYRGYGGNDDAQWVPSYERRYPYHNDTLLMADSLFQWIEAEKVWELVDCHKYQYDSQFRMHTDSYYKLVVHTGEYLLSFRDYYFYLESSGIEEPFRDGWMLYPNPTHGKFQVTSNKTFNHRSFGEGGQISTVKLEVIDLYGNIVHKCKTQKGTANRVHDISHLPAGVYFVRILIEDQMIVKKIIKL